jgi:hypothetical protein
LESPVAAALWWLYLDVTALVADGVWRGLQS